MSLANALPEPLRKSRPIMALDQSIKKGRLAHGILLHGNDLDLLEDVGLALASVLLKPAGEVTIHPDFSPCVPRIRLDKSALITPANLLDKYSIHPVRVKIRLSLFMKLIE